MDALSALAGGFASPCACALRCVLARGCVSVGRMFYRLRGTETQREGGHQKLSAGADVSRILWQRIDERGTIAVGPGI